MTFGLFEFYLPGENLQFSLVYDSIDIFSFSHKKREIMFVFFKDTF